MKLLKFFCAFFVVVVGLFLFVANFSGVDTRFQCPGEMSSHDESQQVTIYMKLDEYRWWVGLWGDSDGCVWLEVPNSFVAFFDRIDESGEHLHIYNNQKKQGYFSTLSKALAITTPDWSFNGTCKKIEK